MTENDIIAAVCAFLEQSDYEVIQRRLTTQRGVDVIARSRCGEQLLHVEAKGATSSRVGSARFGRPYRSVEIRINVAEAVYTAAVGAMHDAPTLWAVAFADDVLHRRYVEPIRPALDALRIGVLWVRGQDECTLESSWELGAVDHSLGGVSSPPRPDELIEEFAGVFDASVYPPGYLHELRHGWNA